MNNARLLKKVVNIQTLAYRHHIQGFYKAIRELYAPSVFGIASASSIQGHVTK